jgi:hypothetical protein
MKEKLIKALEIYGSPPFRRDGCDAYKMAKSNLSGRNVYATNKKRVRDGCNVIYVAMGYFFRLSTQ